LNYSYSIGAKRDGWINARIEILADEEVSVVE
jgi:hypothetical protein